MELYKKGRILILAVIALLGMNVKLQAQDATIAAFKDSYTLEKNGEYAKAIEKIKTVYTEDSYEMNLRLGWLNYEAGQYYEAISFYNKAITLRPYAVEPRFGMVYPVYALGKIDEVITQYSKILEIDPQNSTANYRMGAIYYGKANYEKAAIYLEKVVNLYPFGYDGLLLYAWCQYKLQKFREAKVLFTKVLMYNPEDSSALEGIGLIK
jgi:tetratricopeptide (TPR) repeat protein